MQPKTLERILCNHEFYRASLYTDGTINMMIHVSGKSFPPTWKHRDAILEFFTQPIPTDEDSPEFADWEDKFCSFLQPVKRINQFKSFG